MNFKGRDCVSHVLQCLAGIHVAPLSLSTQSAVSDRHFLIWEKSAYLAEDSVTDITEIFKPRNPGGIEHAQCVPGSFSSAHA